MVDRTAYADEAHTPKIALRQIFGRLGLRSELCRAAADGGLLSVEVFAMLGDTATAVKTSLYRRCSQLPHWGWMLLRKSCR
jgi:hypothetical protein